MSDNNNNNINVQDMLDAGVHFGHLRSKWNPKMHEYIFMEKNGIHLIDLNKSAKKLDEACSAIKNIAKSGRKILFVATKKQAKEIIKEAAERVNMPYVTDRWLGGMLTNFATVRKSIKRMSIIDKMIADGTVLTMAKKERLMLDRERAKLEKVLGGINDLTRLPAALYIVDIKKEHIAIAEAKKLNLTSFGIVDTNADPDEVDFPIPGNDDATKSIALITNHIVNAMIEGFNERKKTMDEKEKEETKEEVPATE
ncbi:MAG: 30S ribosomal protein S2 [Bacteroidetes bacterium]|nr:30S ribosomal protein S2 [Bacteroidota bacterium]